MTTRSQRTVAKRRNQCPCGAFGKADHHPSCPNFRDICPDCSQPQDIIGHSYHEAWCAKK